MTDLSNLNEARNSLRESIKHAEEMRKKREPIIEKLVIDIHEMAMHVAYLHEEAKLEETDISNMLYNGSLQKKRKWWHLK